MTNVLSAASEITKPHDLDAQIIPTTYEMPMNALIVHAHWIDLILNGTKTWEIRSQTTIKKRTHRFGYNKVKVKSRSSQQAWSARGYGVA